jgi:alkaline phosphatase D
MMVPTPFLAIAVAGLASLVSYTDASYSKNLNYRSPSENHPSLGISIHKVNKRNVVTAAVEPSSLNFTHGVASGGKNGTNTITRHKC